MRARDVKGTRANRVVEQGGRVLPKKLFSKYNIDDDPFFETTEDIEDLAEKGETAYVGEYQLVKVHKVKLDLKIA